MVTKLPLWCMKLVFLLHPVGLVTNYFAVTRLACYSLEVATTFVDYLYITTVL